jgi:hypothetical protein
LTSIEERKQQVNKSNSQGQQMQRNFWSNKKVTEKCSLTQIDISKGMKVKILNCDPDFKHC